MDAAVFLAVFLCVLIGLTLSLLGGGGSVLIVPLLVYLAKFPVNESIAMSLIIVGVASAYGSIKYLKEGFVNKRLVLLFVLPGIIASFAGARVAEYVPSKLLLFMFGAMMILISMILYKKSSQGRPKNEIVVCCPDLTVSVAAGTVIGFLTGLLGVGGGFLIVPTIALLMKCSLYTAIGTSLAIIAINSLTGFIGHLSAIKINLFLTGFFLIATLAGAVAGTKVSGALKLNVLQKIFAGLIFFVGIFLAAQNFPYEFRG